jgi:hypothetical protein
MSSQNKPNVVTTRWWWVHHAPVRSDGGNIYGQTDIACDTSDREGALVPPPAAGLSSAGRSVRSVASRTPKRPNLSRKVASLR